MLFVGNMNHAPNREAVEAMLSIAADGWPADSRGLIPLFLVGPFGSPGVNTSHVKHMGHMPTAALHDLYCSVRVVIAPLQSGAGLKGKVVEGLGHGVPVVGTHIAFEGINIKNGSGAFISDVVPSLFNMVAQLHSMPCRAWMSHSHLAFEIPRQFSGTEAVQSLEQALTGAVHRIDFRQQASCQGYLELLSHL
jgi:glycosyltransferase involved in cell wall biosynthesis